MANDFSQPSTSSNYPIIVQWLLDTRPLWPVSQKTSPKDEVHELKTVASRALSLLTASEQAAVLQFYHVRDAKTSLASHLLKHLVITKYCGVAWHDSVLGRDANKKPCFVRPSASSSTTGISTIEFNVSHQAGIVSLIASFGFEGKVDVGTDVVCVDERVKQDHTFIEKEGFFSWVDMHGDVFAKRELNEMKLYPVQLPSEVLGENLRGFAKDQISRCQWRNQKIRFGVEDGGGHRQTIGPIDTNLVIDAKLRRFYAFWCLREAYVKMTGEALLAPWLGDLEFRDVQPPSPSVDMDNKDSLLRGDTVTELNMFFKGRRIEGVQMDLQAMGMHYMISAALRVELEADRDNAILGSWQHLDLERDVLQFAESRL